MADVTGEAPVGFNSKLVRLKVNIREAEAKVAARFNSKLVRLKVDYGTPEMVYQNQFQFQTGSIKRTSSETC